MLNGILVAIASFAGVLLYFSPLRDIVLQVGVVLLVIAILVTFEAVRRVVDQPITATRMFRAWTLVPLSIVLLASMAATWLSLNVLDYLPTGSIPSNPADPDVGKEERGLLVKAAIGAITTILSILVVKAAKDEESWIWPAHVHRWALKKAAKSCPELKLSEPRHAVEDLFAAMTGDSTTDNSATGWTAADRMRRAEIMRASLDAIRAHADKQP